MLHVVSGDCAADLLRASDLPGTPVEIVGWRDSAAVGPSPGGLSFADYREVRAAFRGVPPESFQDVDLLAALPPGEEVVLWFDACPYDQTILVRLLAWFGTHRPQNPTRALHLVQVGEFPGVDPFYGLGQLTAAQLASLFPERQPVTAAQLALAAAAWQAHGSSDPREVERLLAGGTEELPYLRRAFLRLLEQFPAAANGLSRTERECLQAVADGGHGFREIFRAVTRMEEPSHGCWYGDCELLATLQGLAAAAAPALTMGTDNAGDRGPRFELTGMGRALLADEADWVEENGIDRWQGGVHLQGREVWRWDGRAGRLLRPAAS